MDIIIFARSYLGMSTAALLDRGRAFGKMDGWKVPRYHRAAVGWEIRTSARSRKAHPLVAWETRASI